MESAHKECLHCLIVKEIGRRLEKGDICGRSALDKLVLVMADLLALASLDDVEATLRELIQDLPEAVAQAHERAIHHLASATEC